LRDHLGSVRSLVSNSSGGVLPSGSIDYDPYGSPTTPTLGGAVGFGYAGMFYHANSGLYLTHYRAYDPRTARWLSRDPIGEFSGTHVRAGEVIYGVELAGSTAALRSRYGFDSYGRMPDISGDLGVYDANPGGAPSSDSLEGAEKSEGPNLYSYVDNNPISQVDPLGDQSLRRRILRTLRPPCEFGTGHFPTFGDCFFNCFKVPAYFAGLGRAVGGLAALAELTDISHLGFIGATMICANVCTWGTPPHLTPGSRIGF
jgi:RHS repeat-associated protein